MMNKKRVLGAVLGICLLTASLFSVVAQGATVITEKPKLTLYVGNVRNLNPGPELTGKRTWTTNNPEVVSVDNKGKIEAKAEGSAKIKVKGKMITQSCKVKVLPVHMKEAEVGAVAGTNIKLKLYCGTNKGITWESSDPQILSYLSDTGSKSKWEAKKAGTVTVTATYKGGAYTCLVQVEGKKIPINEIPEGGITVLPEL